MLNEQIIFAFSLSLFAGLSTGIGSALIYFTKKTNIKLLSFVLGFSAGVMIYVSLVEIFPESMGLFEEAGLIDKAELFTTLSFFGGVVLVMLIDFFIPSAENPHHLPGLGKKEGSEAASYSAGLKRVGVMTAIALAIHNFPEGIATFTSALVLPEVGIPIALAVAIHNIPEGMAVSIPIYHATGSQKKAFWISVSSGLSEPLGALFSFIILRNHLTSDVLGVIMGAVAGIMVYISVDELLPAAERFGKHHYSIVGFIFGMIVMAGSILLLGEYGL